MRKLTRQLYLLIVCLIIFFYYSDFLSAQQSLQTKPAEKKPLPIIDMHVHSISVNNFRLGEICPWFLEEMPGTDPKTGMSFPSKDCVDPWKPPKDDNEMTAGFLETLEKLNITAVVFCDNPEILYRWKKSAPGRIIPGIGVSVPENITVQAMRDSLSSGFYKVMAECAPQYQGISPSDMSLDEYFSIAEELDIPVGIHMGTGGNGMANIMGTKFRAAMGNPLELEDLLHRHPKLRVWVMHAGYPFIDELIAVMGWNAYVFLDISGFIWSYPLEEIHMVIKRLVQAGFGKRIMYGTDFIGYPDMIKTSIGVIQNASYLTEEQKRDILYNNAARFLRLNEIGEN
ncbi:MAG: amidohydrolase family protein [Bacteroidales bacterium]